MQRNCHSFLFFHETAGYHAMAPAGRGHQTFSLVPAYSVCQAKQVCRRIPPYSRPELAALNHKGNDILHMEFTDTFKHILLPGLSGHRTPVVRFTAVWGTQKICMAHIDPIVSSPHGVGQMTGDLIRQWPG
jgi:hypothetical protein